MSDFLFDTPYWALGVIALVGVALWTSGNARRDRRLMGGAYGAFAVAVLLGLLSYFVDTDREKVIKGTRALGEAVDRRDRATAERLLHPKARFGEMDRAALVDAIATAADRARIKDVRVTGINVAPVGADELSVSFTATASVEVGGMSFSPPTSWRFIWEKTPDRGWQARTIELVSAPGMDEKEVVRRASGK
jgi:hypothetical protein